MLSVGKSVSRFPKENHDCMPCNCRIKQCTEVETSWVFISHHEMGHIEYYLQYASEPTMFRDGANPGRKLNKMLWPWLNGGGKCFAQGIKFLWMVGGLSHIFPLQAMVTEIPRLDRSKPVLMRQGLVLLSGYSW